MLQSSGRFLSLARPIQRRIAPNAQASLRRKYGKFEKFPSHPNTLYDKALEKDSCGVGLVANMKRLASRNIVLDANEMLVRMSHRGGCGCEPNSGDGAGILV
jgi:hypothetical protein